MKKNARHLIKKSIFFALLIFIAQFSYLILRDSTEYSFAGGFLFYLSCGIYIGIFAYWTFSIYNRIMKCKARDYLIFIGIIMIFWIVVRSIKWTAFILLIEEARAAWYLFYVPYLVAPTLCVFVALTINKNEDYRPDKRWNILFIITAILLLLVLSNDFHKLVFNANLEVHDMLNDYTHNVLYYVIVVYILALFILTATVLAKNIRVGAESSRRVLKLLALLFVIVICYLILYVLNISLIRLLVDTTVFSCLSFIVFWEICIQGGLIPTNRRHGAFFSLSDLSAQILDKVGVPKYSSFNSEPLTEERFLTLKDTGTIKSDNELQHMTKITGGYVSWASDISEISELINELTQINSELYDEIELLSEERKQEEETLKIKEQLILHNILTAEMQPHIEKIISKIAEGNHASAEDKKTALFEVSLISAYLKRKVNLIILSQVSEKTTAKELQLVFEECFQVLRLHSVTCIFSIITGCELHFDTAMLCLDLFQTLVENLFLSLNVVYMTVGMEDDDMKFTISVDNEDSDLSLLLSELNEKEVLPKGYRLNISKESDGQHICLTAKGGLI